MCGFLERVSGAGPKLRWPEDQLRDVTCFYRAVTMPGLGRRRPQKLLIVAVV